MERVTITGVHPDHKRSLAVIAAKRGTTVSKLLRERIERIVMEDEGDIPTRESINEHVEALERVIELYQRRRYQDAEALLFEISHG